MTWTITTEEVAPPVPDGEYPAMPVAIQIMNGRLGSLARIEFQINREGPWDKRRVTGIASMKLTANSKLGAWIAAILGGMPAVGREIMEADLLHKACVVVVRQNINENGRVLVRVIEVRSAK